MRRFYDSESIRKADSSASALLGIPGSILMENAGRGASEAIVSKFPRARRFLILCGPGNNGGDGFVVARHLLLHGFAPVVLSTIAPDAYKGDAKGAAYAAGNSRVEISISSKLDDEEILFLAEDADVIVDALLGTGSKGGPRGEVSRLISLCCHEGRTIVSLDMPSGIDPDTGEVASVAVTASLTVTFLAEKTGLAVAPASFHCGEIDVRGIGAQPELVLQDAPRLIGYEASDVCALSPLLPVDAHKGSKGGLMIVGGSHHYRGAPVLAARGALRAGCGFVCLAVPEFAVSEASSLLPEAVFLPLAARGGHIEPEDLERTLPSWLDRCDAVVLGPGLGRSDDARRIVGRLYESWRKPLLLDADALYFLKEIAGENSSARDRTNTVLTPHTGEAARLLGKTAAEISAARLRSCEFLARRFGTTLLKGPHTLVSDGECSRVVLEGGPFLAVPGSGDVLAGVIGALLASGMSCMDAATLGALLHALSSPASGVAEGVRSGFGLLANEIADGIRLVGTGSQPLF